MALTVDHIRFIDHYLIHSEVVFADLRAEMTDHIASAVEAKMQTENLDFYDAFKNYMAVHKKEILKGNKDSAGYSFSVLKQFGKFLITPQMLAFAVLNFVLLTIYFRYNGLGILKMIGPNTPLYTVMAIAVLQLVLFFAVLKKRFYYIEKNSFILAFLYYPALVFIDRQDYNTLNIYLVEGYVYLTLAYVIYVLSTTYRFVQSNPLRSV